MAELYVNPAGQSVTRHSYSSGEMFESCNYHYFLDKVKGLKRKDKSAALAFGRCLESALQFHHDNKLTPGAGADEFKRLWLKFKDNTELRYTNSEKDWNNLYRAGAEMLLLYQVLLPSLPIVDPVWQASVNKEVFPGTELAGISDLGYLDIISRAPWDHPLLPRVRVPADSPYRPLVVDVKTSGKPLDVDPRFMGMDPQLAVYAWLSGIPDVGFLWFTKSVADAYESGTRVSLLENSGKWTAGDGLVIFRYDSETEIATLGSAEDIQELKGKLGEIKGKGSTETKNAVVDSFLADQRLVCLPPTTFTKQRIQFAAARISEEDIRQAGERAARQIVNIVDCHKRGVWLKNRA